MTVNQRLSIAAAALTMSLVAVYVVDVMAGLICTAMACAVIAIGFVVSTFEGD